MPVTTGTFTTPNASRYLQQLCKHFGHKIEVAYTPTHGTCHFEFGVAELSADDTTLKVQITLTDSARLELAHMVIDQHLERFAFREAFKTMSWQTEA